MQELVSRSRSLKVLVVDVGVLTGVDPDEVVPPLVLLQSLPHHVSVSPIDLRYPLEQQLVLVKEVIQAFFLVSTREHLLGLATGLGVVLPGLVGLGPHDVLDSVLHLGQVVSPPVELLHPHQVERVYYQT